MNLVNNWVKVCGKRCEIIPKHFGEVNVKMSLVFHSDFPKGFEDESADRLTE